MLFESPVSVKSLRQRLASLENERNSFEQVWIAVAQSQAPGRLRLYQQDYNEGYDRYAKLVDNEAVYARRVAVAGFVSGYSSQARPWFRFGTEDTDMMERTPVRAFLEMAQQRAEAIIFRGGFYRMAPNVYDDMLSFATAFGGAREHPEHLLSFHNHAMGEGYLAIDQYGRPETHMREVWRTTEQLVQQFGYDRCSKPVQNAWDNNRYYETHCIVAAVVRNPDFDPARRDVRAMPFAEIYFERNQGGAEGLLGREGYRSFPNFCPRWYAGSGDAYGTDCPGMIALGDVRQLQAEILMKGEAIDSAVRPARMFPDIFDDDLDVMPGGINFYDSSRYPGPGASGPIDNRPHYGIEPLLHDIGEVRERIRRSYFNDLFLMISALEKGEVTATEVERRHEEKLLMLGPTGVHLQDEFLGPLVERVFDTMILEGVILPEEIPEELAGQNLKIEYIGPLAMAQQSVGLQSVERVVNFTLSLAQAKPEIMDKVDFDQAVDEYARRVGAPARVVRSDDDTAVIRQQRAEQAQAQALIGEAAPLSQALKNVSEAAQDGADR